MKTYREQSMTRHPASTSSKSIGRALAALGFGTQFAPDLEEGNRIVDAPVDQARRTPTPEQGKHLNESNAVSDELVTIDSLFTLYSSAFNQGWDRLVTSVVGGKYATDRVYTLAELKKISEKVTFMISKAPKSLQSAS